MIPFRNCWDYAMQLLRTRLVSASLRLQFHWDVKNAFSVGNSNILTMMLYWLLSQFVNIVERKVLISRAKSIDQHIRITEDILAVSIDFDVPVRDIQLMIEQSLLMNHLLELEHLLLFSDQDNQIIIKKANNN